MSDPIEPDAPTELLDKAIESGVSRFSALKTRAGGLFKRRHRRSDELDAEDVGTDFADETPVPQEGHESLEEDDPVAAFEASIQAGRWHRSRRLLIAAGISVAVLTAALIVRPYLKGKPAAEPGDQERIVSNQQTGEKSEKKPTGPVESTLESPPEEPVTDVPAPTTSMASVSPVDPAEAPPVVVDDSSPVTDYPPPVTPVAAEVPPPVVEPAATSSVQTTSYDTPPLDDLAAAPPVVAAPEAFLDEPPPPVVNEPPAALDSQLSVTTDPPLPSDAATIEAPKVITAQEQNDPVVAGPIQVSESGSGELPLLPLDAPETLVDSQNEVPPMVDELPAMEAPAEELVMKTPAFLEPSPSEAQPELAEPGSHSTPEPGALALEPTPSPTPVPQNPNPMESQVAAVNSSLPAASESQERSLSPSNPGSVVFPSEEERAAWVPLPNLTGRRAISNASMGDSAATPSVRLAERPSAPEGWNRHIVQRGENFWTISRTYYGTGKYYRSLWEANREHVPLIDELYIGTELLIPPLKELVPSATQEIQAKRDTAIGLQSFLTSEPTEPESVRKDEMVEPARKGKTSPEPPSDRPQASGEVHVVAPNETLRSIARLRLGDPDRADEIHQLNTRKIRDPRILPENLVLDLPIR